MAIPRIVIDRESPDPAVLARAAGVLRRGGVLALPTDTQYGLAADAANRTAVERVREVKRLERGTAILVLVPDRAWAERWSHCLAAEVSRSANGLMDEFWPGPLTLVLPAGPEVPVWIRGERTTVALRWPGPGVAADLLRVAGFPITATSANLHGEDPAASGVEVEERFGEELDLILDAGPVGEAAPSTMIDVTGIPPRLLRRGAIAEEKVLPWLQTKADPS